MTGRCRRRCGRPRSRPRGRSRTVRSRIAIASLERDADAARARALPLDGPGVRHQVAAAEDRRSGMPGDLVGVSARQRSRLDRRRAGLDRLEPGVVLGRRRADLDEAGASHSASTPCARSHGPSEAIASSSARARPDAPRRRRRADQPGRLVAPARDDSAGPARRAEPRMRVDELDLRVGRARACAIGGQSPCSRRRRSRSRPRPTANGGAATSARAPSNSGASRRQPNERRRRRRRRRAGSSTASSAVDGAAGSDGRIGRSPAAGLADQPVERPGRRRAGGTRRSSGRRRSGGSRRPASRRRGRPSRASAAGPRGRPRSRRARIGVAPPTRAPSRTSAPAAVGRVAVAPAERR